MCLSYFCVFLIPFVEFFLFLNLDVLLEFDQFHSPIASYYKHRSKSILSYWFILEYIERMDGYETDLHWVTQELIWVQWGEIHLFMILDEVHLLLTRKHNWCYWILNRDFYKEDIYRSWWKINMKDHSCQGFYHAIKDCICKYSSSNELSSILFT